jgi:hypothetical protein
VLGRWNAFAPRGGQRASERIVPARAAHEPFGTVQLKRILLQRTAGNRAVCRQLDIHRSPDSAGRAPLRPTSLRPYRASTTFLMGDFKHDAF